MRFLSSFVALAVASTVLGNYIDGGDYPPYGPYNITDYALACASYPPFTCSYSFNITYAPDPIFDNPPYNQCNAEPAFPSAYCIGQASSAGSSPSLYPCVFTPYYNNPPYNDAYFVSAAAVKGHDFVNGGGIGNVSVVVQHDYGTSESPNCGAASYEITGLKNVTIKYPGKVLGFQIFATGESAQG